MKDKKQPENHDVKEQMKKTRATKEEVKKATAEGIKRYKNTLKDLEKR